MTAPQISISIVSHGHGPLVERLLADFTEHVMTPHEILLTLNVPERAPVVSDSSPAALHLIRNASPQGFGCNHNAAFRESSAPFFCVMNPDVRIDRDPFPDLMQCLRDPAVGVAAPLIRGRSGEIEDSARRFITPGIIVRKLFRGGSQLDYAVDDAPVYPDWVAGMFMLLRRETFAAIGGFDERYFLYYEDVDLCARLRASGQRAMLCPRVEVTHLAQRESRRNLRHVRWHLASMFRYLCSYDAAGLPRRRG